MSAYSIGFGREDRFHSELDAARVVATHFGTDHHEMIAEPDVAALIPKLVCHLDQPLADSSFVVTYLVSTLAVKGTTSGVGGGEVFGGHRRYLGPRLSGSYDASLRVCGAGSHARRPASTSTGGVG